MEQLIDKLSSARTLRRAWEKVKRNKVSIGIDDVTLDYFEKRLSTELPNISQQIRTGRYSFQPAIRKAIPKHPGSTETRDIHIFTVRDKVVQQAIQTLLLSNRKQTSLFPELYGGAAVAYVPGSRGVQDTVVKTIQYFGQGYEYLTTLDIRDFFDKISKKNLIKKLLSRLPDHSIDWLIIRTIDQKVYDGGILTPEYGVLQGAILSPFYSNVYMSDFDIALASAGIIALRYADDLAIYSKSKTEAHLAVETASKLLKKHCALEFYPDTSPKGPKFQHLKKYGQYLGIAYTMNSRKRLSIAPAQSCLKAQLEKITLKMQNPKYSFAENILRTNSSVTSWVDYYRAAHCHKANLEYCVKKIHSHFCHATEYQLKQIKILDKNAHLAMNQLQSVGVIRPKQLLKK